MDLLTESDYDNDDLHLNVDVHYLRCSICQRKLKLVDFPGNEYERNRVAAMFAQEHSGFDHELWHDGVVARSNDQKQVGLRVSFALQAGGGKDTVRYA